MTDRGDPDSTPTLRERWRATTLEERRARERIVKEVRRRGPLWTAHQVIRGNLGGPVTSFVVERTSWLGGGVLRNLWMVRLIAFVGPLLAAFGALTATNKLLTGGGLVAQLAFVFVLAAAGLLAAGGLYVLALRPTRGKVLRWVSGWSHEDLIWCGLLLLVLPTVAFASVSAFLVHQDWIGFKGVSADAPKLAYKTFDTYLWNLADAIPLLDVPGTLHWKPQVKFTTFSGGALVLAYKLLLVLPFVQLAAIALGRSFGDGGPRNAGRDDEASKSR